MGEFPSLVFFTYSRSDIPAEQRWSDRGIPPVFFEDETTAREALLELRDEIAQDPNVRWPAMNLERVETVPVTRESILALVNNGLSAFMLQTFVIETVGAE